MGQLGFHLLQEWIEILIRDVKTDLTHHLLFEKKNLI